MTERFLERNLCETILFLDSIGLGKPAKASLSSKELAAIALQNSGKHERAYQSLQCGVAASYPQTPVFCTCCSPITVFLRNNSLRLVLRRKTVANNLRLVSKNTAVSDTPAERCAIFRQPGFTGDPFTDFLIADFTKDISLARRVVASEVLFWEGFQLLAELADKFIEVSGPLSSLFYMLLKIQRDIDPRPQTLLPFNSSPGITQLPYPLDNRDKHLLAAFYYVSGESELALKTFTEIFPGSRLCKPPTQRIARSDIRYFEMYAQMLYAKNDKRLAFLAEAMASEENLDATAEAQCVLGIHRMANKDFQKAKRHFIKSLGRAWNVDVICMLGHVYYRLGLREDATRAFMKALSDNQDNFRITYTVAQGFFLLENNDRCIFYCQRALLRRVDGSVWKLMGKALLKKKDVRSAMHCFDQAEKCGEKDSLLYKAEYLMKNNNVPEAVVLYEKYLHTGAHNRESIARYLAEYYCDLGDDAKSQYYRSIIQ